MDMRRQREIEQEVDKILALPFVSGLFPVPVEKIAEHLNFECYLFKADARTMDISGVVNHQTKKILINQNDPPQRQLFTVAHELGHILLHGNHENYIDYRKKTSDPKEVEANYFAASLLMPEDLFRFQWRTKNKDITAISRFFGVSTGAAAIRSDSLGLD